MRTAAVRRRLENNLSVSWFHHVWSRDGSQVLSLGGTCLCPLNHLAGPKNATLNRFSGFLSATVEASVTMEKCQKSPADPFSCHFITILESPCLVLI
jgi:hypothetical protein